MLVSSCNSTYRSATMLTTASIPLILYHDYHGVLWSD